MNLGSVWDKLTVKERQFLFTTMHVYVWDCLETRALIRIIINKEYNKLPFINLLTIIKSVELYRLNTTISLNDMKMIEVLLKKLKGRE